MKFLVRPKEINCVFPVTELKKIGSVGRKIFFLINIFIWYFRPISVQLMPCACVKLTIGLYLLLLVGYKRFAALVAIMAH